MHTHTLYTYAPIQITNFLNRSGCSAGLGGQTYLGTMQTWNRATGTYFVFG